jgi:DNA-3-methyladenine glycosylase
MLPEYPRLDAAFYRRTDVVQVAKDLLGKYLVTGVDDRRTVGMITETEAYRGPDDRACHAWNNRCTPRTRVMFEAGGLAYVYLCYGIHHLFNVVTGEEQMPHAVLIRAVQPVENIALMLARRGMRRESPKLSHGPGTLSQALGIHSSMSGTSLLSEDSLIWLEDAGVQVEAAKIMAGPRIGVDYAGADALRPWRFRI